MRDGHVNWLCRLVAVLVMLFLVAPLVVIVLASFTPTALVTFPPQGFSLKWYANIFGSSTHFMDGLVKSLQIGIRRQKIHVGSIFQIGCYMPHVGDSQGNVFAGQVIVSGMLPCAIKKEFVYDQDVRQFAEQQTRRNVQAFYLQNTFSHIRGNVRKYALDAAGFGSAKGERAVLQCHIAVEGMFCRRVCNGPFQTGREKRHVGYNRFQNVRRDGDMRKSKAGARLPLFGFDAVR